MEWNNVKEKFRVIIDFSHKGNFDKVLSLTLKGLTKRYALNSLTDNGKINKEAKNAENNEE